MGAMALGKRVVIHEMNIAAVVSSGWLKCTLKK